MIRWFLIGFGLAFIFIGLLVRLPEYVPNANTVMFIIGVILFVTGLVAIGIKDIIYP